MEILIGIVIAAALLLLLLRLLTRRSRDSRICCVSSSGRRKVNFSSRAAAQNRADMYGGSVYECVNEKGTFHHRSRSR